MLGGGLLAKSYPTLGTPWTPLSMGFSRQEYWSELPFSSPGDLPGPGIKCKLSPMSPALTGRFLTTVPPGKLCRLPGSESECVSHSVVLNSL